VVVFPGVFKLVSEAFDGLDALGADHDEAYGCGAQTTDDQEEIFHCCMSPYTGFAEVVDD
jgi:hypothetical protein